MSLDTESGELRENSAHPRRHAVAPPPRKIIDMHLPLTWLLSSIGAFALLLGGMYMQIGQLSKDVIELKTSVNTSNSQSAAVLGEVAVLKYRMDSIEKREGLK
jgi:hypothetical protein